MRTIVILAALLAVVAGFTPWCAAQPCSEIPFSSDYVGSIHKTGVPGDTVWVPVWITNRTTLVNFTVIMSYDQDVMTPVLTGGEYVLSRATGRFSGSDFFTVQLRHDFPESSIVAHMLQPDVGPDTIPPGSGAVMEIAFSVDPLADIGTASYLTFPRRTEWIPDSAGGSPDSMAVCLGTNFAVRGEQPDEYVSSWPRSQAGQLVVDSVLPAAPAIDYFFVDPRSGYQDDRVRVQWQVSDADSIVITPNDYVSPASLFTDSVSLMSAGDMRLTAFGLDTSVSKSWPIYAALPGENRHPYLVVTPFDTLSATAGDDFYIEMFASDPDATTPQLSVSPLPNGATLTNLEPWFGALSWTPADADTGLHALTTYAVDEFDPTLVDSIPFWIKVNGVNHPPTWTFDDTTKLIWEMDTITVPVQAQDPDGTPPIIDAHLYLQDTLAENMTFVDSGNGVGVVTFIPDHFQGNRNPSSYGLVFTITDAEDPSMVGQTSRKTILVRNVNTGAEAPTITLSADSDSLHVQETDLLEFEILATTSLGDLPEVTASLPAGATLEFVSGPALENHKRFRWQPDYGTAGDYSATFYAQNGTLIDSADVTITVVETNQPPFIYLPPSTEQIYEEDTVIIHAVSFDPDSTVPRIEAFLDGSDTLAKNMTMVDSGNGAATLTFIPNRVQGGCSTEEPAFYYVRFKAIDAEPPYHEVSSSTRSIIVHDTGEPCCIGSRGDLNYDGNGYAGANVSDLVSLVDYVFGSHAALPCWQEGDLNGDGSIVISDLTYLVDYLFRTGPPPVNCVLTATAKIVEGQ